MTLINKNKGLIFVIFLSLVINISAGYYFTFVDQTNLAYFDANTRLNIARRIFDNLTPGIAQVGNVWPPFPQILMMPLVASDYLWRTGIAGWIISGIAYCLATGLIYKSTELLTGRKDMALIGAVAFLLNINLIYLSTTAMSEAFFIFCSCGLIYFVSKYLYNGRKIYILLSAGATFLATLTRYEGYAFLPAVVIIFGFLFWSKHKTWKNFEGTMLLYLVPAGFGISLWMIYLWAIFGDPLYWLHYYTSETPAAANSVQKAHASISEAINIYSQAGINMLGLVTFGFGVIATVFILVNRNIRREVKLLTVLPLFIYLFMVYSLTHKTVINQPFLKLNSLTNTEYSRQPEFNIRYGLNLLPFAIIFGAVMAGRSRAVKYAWIVLIAVQTSTYFFRQVNFTYQLRQSVNYGVSSYTRFIGKEYKNGLILISAAHHDPEMLQTNLPYRYFIHEGTQNYWTESLANPQTFASWVVFDRAKSGDPVYMALGDKNLNDYGFELVYLENGLEVYKKIQ